jgi:hypothetical protein
MNALSKRSSHKLASIHSSYKKSTPTSQIILKQLRYEELDAEYSRQKRKLHRMIHNIKKSASKD